MNSDKEYTAKVMTEITALISCHEDKARCGWAAGHRAFYVIGIHIQVNLRDFPTIIP